MPMIISRKGRLAAAMLLGLAGAGLMAQDAQAAIEVNLNVGGRNVVPLLSTGVQNLSLTTKVTGVNGVADEAMQTIAGDLLSSGTGAGLGNLTFTAAAPFTAGQSGGTAADLDADGDLDLGTTASSAVSPPHIWARAASMQVSPTVDVGNYTMGEVTWNVTTLGAGAGVGNEKTTSVTWRKGISAGNIPSLSYNADGGTNENGGSAGLSIVGTTFYIPYAVADVKAADAGDEYLVEDTSLGLTLNAIGVQSTFGQGGANGAKFEWDLDNDGQFDDAFVLNPTLSSAQLNALGAGLHDIKLRVTARDNNTDLPVTQIAAGVINIVPEPATLGLLGLGGLMLLGRGRRRA